MSAATLGELTDVLSGFAFKSSGFSDEGDLPVIRIRDVVRGRSETFYTGEYDPKFLIRNGETLIGMDGEFNCARWTGGDALLNQRVCRIEPTSPHLDSNYLFRFLPRALKAIERDTPFVTVKHLSAKTIRSIEIPLPPIGEQRRIAAILDAADALRAKRRQALAKLDTLTQAIFIDMFGDRLSNTVALGQLVEEFRYGTSGKSKDSGTPVFRIPNVTGGVLDFSEIKRVPLEPKELERLRLIDGDVMFVRSNGNPDYVGRCATFTKSQVTDEGFIEDFAYASYLIRARLDLRSLEPTFLVQFINSQIGRQAIRSKCKTSAGQYNLNTKGLGSVKIPLPSLPDQQAFVRQSTSVTAHRSEQLTQLERLENVFASIQQRAFRGEL